jgi:hypothetical protein
LAKNSISSYCNYIIKVFFLAWKSLKPSPWQYTWIVMSDMYICQKCGETYFVYDGEEPVCGKCKSRLMEMCEWCDLPEKECKCKKDDINVE